MQETDLILFLAASLALIIAPGPDNILVLTRGIAQGRGAALVSAAGARLGLVVHSIFAAVGLSALLQQSATAFLVVKYVGAAYLIYLGIKTLLRSESFVAPRRGGPHEARKRLRSGRRLEYPEPKDCALLPGLPAAVRRTIR